MPTDAACCRGGSRTAARAGSSTHAWLIPVIPAVGFALILLIGKRLPEEGLRGRPSRRWPPSFVLAVGHRDPVDQPRRGRRRRRGRHRACCTASASRCMPRAEEAHAAVAPVVTSWTWWQSGGMKFGIGTLHRRPRRRPAARRHDHLAAGAHLLDGVHAGRHPLHPLLRLPRPVHRRHAHAWSSPRTRSSCCSAGRSWASARSS